MNSQPGRPDVYIRGHGLLVRLDVRRGRLTKDIWHGLRALEEPVHLRRLRGEWEVRVVDLGKGPRNERGSVELWRGSLRRCSFTVRGGGFPLLLERDFRGVFEESEAPAERLEQEVGAQLPAEDVRTAWARQKGA